MSLDDHDSMNSVLRRNIEAMRAKRAEQAARASAQERLAALITRFAGSMGFVYVHAAIVLAWIAVNLGFVPGVAAFDPTFVILATAASVEAIFLSTFILISQNRASALADARADLDLQVSLLAEHEVTRILALCTAMAEHLKLSAAADPRLEELKRDVAPEAVLDELEQAQDPPA
jgi:uncharacterized membrane protein